MSTGKQKIAVVGAGAVGCFFGGMLARSQQELILIGRAERVDAINRFGLQMDCQGFQATVALQACADFTDIADVDVILLCVKSYDTLATMQAMQPFLSANTVIVSLQNGVSNVELIASIVANPVYAAAVYVAVAMTDLNTVKHYGRGELQIGAFTTDFTSTHKPPRALTQLVDQFINAGVPCALSANIKIALWLKLLVNCSYNAISAIGQISYGQMVQVPHIQVLIERLTDEFLSIAQCEAVTISKEEAAQANAIIAKTMAGQKSSTAADLARGKLSEIDFLNGYIVEKGLQYNLATPANQAVYALVKMIEAEFK